MRGQVALFVVDQDVAGCGGTLLYLRIMRNREIHQPPYRIGISVQRVQSIFLCERQSAIK